MTTIKNLSGDAVEVANVTPIFQCKINNPNEQIAWNANSVYIFNSNAMVLIPVSELVKLARAKEPLLTKAVEDDTNKQQT